MPPHLHPRSRMTSSLFATTIAASFLVVTLPHVLPCPAPRVKLADAAAETADDGALLSSRRPRSSKRIRREQEGQGREEARAVPLTSTGMTEIKDGIAQFGAPRQSSQQDGQEKKREAAEMRTRPQRECPVPKPGGVIGKILGFGKKEREIETTKSTERKAGTEGPSSDSK